jgi:hypothetical protein
MENFNYNPFQEIINELREVKDLISKQNSVQVKEEPEADIIDVYGASKMIHLTPATIYNKVNRKEIPYFKTGGKLYFSKKALLLYIKEGRKKTLEEIRAEVNETICQQKKKPISSEDKRPSLPERVKRFTATSDLENQTLIEALKGSVDRRPTLPERVKRFTATSDLENQTPEEASKDAANLHFDIYTDELNKDAE